MWKKEEIITIPNGERNLYITLNSLNRGREVKFNGGTDVGRSLRHMGCPVLERRREGMICPYLFEYRQEMYDQVKCNRCSFCEETFGAIDSIVGEWAERNKIQLQKIYDPKSGNVDGVKYIQYKTLEKGSLTIYQAMGGFWRIETRPFDFAEPAFNPRNNTIGVKRY